MVMKRAKQIIFKSKLIASKKELKEIEAMPIRRICEAIMWNRY
jgi:hypothetical protein